MLTVPCSVHDGVTDAVPGERYLLPTTLLHHGGLYEYVLIDVGQARQWLAYGPYRSWLSHPFVHAAFEQLTAVRTPPPCLSPMPVLGYKDDALVFLVEGYETLPALWRGNSRQVTRLIDAERYTLGLFKRLA